MKWKKLITISLFALVVIAAVAFGGRLRRASKQVSDFRNRWGPVTNLLVLGTTVGDQEKPFQALVVGTSNITQIAQLKRLFSNTLSPLRLRRWSEGRTISSRLSLRFFAIDGSNSNLLCRISGDSLMFLTADTYCDCADDLHSLTMQILKNK